jgi:hypothetical protein
VLSTTGYCPEPQESIPRNRLSCFFMIHVRSRPFPSICVWISQVFSSLLVFRIRCVNSTCVLRLNPLDQINSINIWWRIQVELERERERERDFVCLCWYGILEYDAISFGRLGTKNFGLHGRQGEHVSPKSCYLYTHYQSLQSIQKMGWKNPPKVPTHLRQKPATSYFRAHWRQI